MQSLPGAGAAASLPPSPKPHASMGTYPFHLMLSGGIPSLLIASRISPLVPVWIIT